MTDLHQPGEDRRSTAGATVLVVDDSRTIRAILRRDLEAAGYVAIEAENGRVGIETAREEAPDIVLLDVDMPVLDGYSALAEMNADPELRHLPVLMLSARTGAEDVATGLGLGAHDYLRKPCAAAELAARIASTLRQIEQEHALIEQQRLLAELSNHDTLTGLGNRRLLEDACRNLLDAGGPDVRVGIALVDLDHFKAVNDTYGHPTGDAVLRVVAARLSGAVPADALAIRWGGEEFAVVQAGDSEAQIMETATRFHASLGNFPLAVGTESPLAVTASIGVASGLLVDFDDVMSRADAAMYRAKSEGRNRVEDDIEDGRSG